MEELAALPRTGSYEEDAARVRLLVADDDPLARSLLAAGAHDVGGGIAVLEAEDGAEAIQLGLQRRPEIALLDVNMPRLGGIEAALTLRALQPRMRVALHTADPAAHRDRAHEHRLPLFGKLELERALSWLRAQVRSLAEPQPDGRGKLELSCSGCGYGVVRSIPPARCPMCQAENAWILAEARLPSPLVAR